MTKVYQITISGTPRAEANFLEEIKLLLEDFELMGEHIKITVHSATVDGQTILG